MTETDLPEPLTPPDCDIRDFTFMPLDVQRLKRSKAWLRAKRKPALGFYMMNLWTASWHERPAGSLEDDDDVLADLAMCDPDIWPSLREEVLYGWIKATDGRLYNPTVAEKANEAWARKLFQRERGRRGNEARWGKGAGTSPSQSDPEGTMGASRKPPRKDRAADPSRKQEASLKDAGKDRSWTIKDRKGQGEGQGEEEESFALLSDAGSDAPAPTEGEEAAPAKPRKRRAGWEPETFPEFYDAYPRHEARQKAATAYVAAVPSNISHADLMAALRRFRFDADRKFIPLPASWLNGRRWQDEPLPREVAAGPARAVDERYFDHPAREVRELPKPAMGTPERHAWDHAVQGFQTPHPSKGKTVPA